MSPAQAILAGAILIAGTVLFAVTIHPAAAQLAPSGQYQLMYHNNPSANTSVFRINSATGEVSYCYVMPGTELTCTKYVR